MPTPSAIDVVYTWVQQDWPGYMEMVQRHSSRPRDANPERFRDHYTLLRYSLRSLEHFCPWVRTVTLFTMRPQVPSWLRRDHPRLRLVHHDEVMDPAILPTFNCNAIESHLHLIPGLSEHFIYLNDDFLFGRATSLDDFYAPDGRIKILGTWAGERLPFRLYDGRNDLFSFGIIEHAPILVDRAIWTEMLADRPGAVAGTRASRFRRDDDLRMDKLYRYHALSRHPRQAVAEPFWRLLRYHRFHKITNRPAVQAAKLGLLRERPPKFYCLNDDQKDRPDERVSALVRAFLEEQYPHPSTFELPR